MCVQHNAGGDRADKEQDFKFQHNLRDMSVTGAAQFLFTILYGNRFFPKYAYCILGGLDKDGKAKLFSYDPVGSYSKEGESRAAAGAASSLIVPFLDNQVSFAVWCGGLGCANDG